MSEILKQEVRNLLNNLLKYDSQKNPPLKSSLKLKTKWHQTSLKVDTTLDSLLNAKIFELIETFSSSPNDKPSNSKDRLRYLLKEILEEKLKLLEDKRVKNDKGTYRGIKNWIFTLKLWHSPEELAYIERNLRAFEQHWYTIYPTQFNRQLPLYNLPPRRYTKLFGYESELDRLLELLSAKSREQIICLQGMSGSGKTALALEVAYYCLEASKDKTNTLSFDAIIFTSAQTTHVVGNNIMPKLLGAEQYLGDIVRVISDTLQFPLEPSLDFERQLRLLLNYLDRKIVLLIIDNLETVRDRDTIANLISHFPETVKIILTSRIPFPQLNSCSITLTHLQPQPGGELIDDLAKKFQRILQSEQITSIYSRTGGLPLAITYQMAQIVTTGIPDNLIGMVVDNTPDELLQFCFADLVKSLSPTPAYHYLLIAALFNQFASTKAIAYIHRTTEEIASSHLQHLANLYLLFPQKTEQYTLHSLTQEYLQQELEKQPDYQAQIRARWVQWYLELVEPYISLSADEWHDYREIEVEWINLRSVVEWCTLDNRYLDVKTFWQSLKGFTRTLGYWTERNIWLDWLLDRAILARDWQMVAEAKFHFSQTLAHIDQTDASGRAMKLAREAWDLKEYCSLDWQLDLSLYITALYTRQTQTNSWKTAQTWCDRSQQIFQTLPTTIPNYSEKKCQLFYYQAEIYTHSQEFGTALDTYQTALKIAKTNNYHRGIAYIRARIAVILINQDLLTEAKEELLSLLKLTEQHQDRRSRTFCYQYLAIVAKKLENVKEAKNYATLAQEGFNNLAMEAAAAEMEKFIAEYN
ncbi:AAA ATPase (plasmid) [Stanieria cyanosphaera PCC 7437]|uniref:AAA ATPase n=1 Tax=Stanieria cyanosphaera (strain ATCC 29371 / PCC 7437) TaxID=111780 RepID=K9Y2Q4_STAC7|nr:NB-ARC domain-containing protein [Stanieria cyanosphaera]AFZ38312.1 AAA ATPase [Stanieria cyanosphaera PCC 7437]